MVALFRVIAQDSLAPEGKRRAERAAFLRDTGSLPSRCGSARLCGRLCRMARKKISCSQAFAVGRSLGVDFRKVRPAQWCMGMNVELEHGRRDRRTNVTNDSPRLTGKIAWAHLNELPDYYTRLAKMERGRSNPARRGVSMGHIAHGEMVVKRLLDDTVALLADKKPEKKIALGRYVLLVYRDFRASVTGAPLETVFWILRKGRTPVGNGQLLRTPEHFEVVWGGLLKVAQGKGLYEQTLRALRVHLGVPIASDTDLSDAAMKTWERMTNAGHASWVQTSQYSGYYRINPSRPRTFFGLRRGSPSLVVWFVSGGEAVPVTEMTCADPWGAGSSWVVVQAPTAREALSVASYFDSRPTFAVIDFAYRLRVWASKAAKRVQGEWCVSAAEAPVFRLNRPSERSEGRANPVLAMRPTLEDGYGFRQEELSEFQRDFYRRMAATGLAITVGVIRENGRVESLSVSYIDTFLSVIAVITRSGEIEIFPSFLRVPARKSGYSPLSRPYNTFDIKRAVRLFVKLVRTRGERVVSWQEENGE